MLAYKVFRKSFGMIRRKADYLRTWWKLFGNGVKFSSFRTNGVPFVSVARTGSMSIGKNFAMNNGINGNPIGCYEKCTFFVDRGSHISIADNVGISQSALVAHDTIEILTNVKIGGGSSIFTTDFHALDPILRASKKDTEYRKHAPVRIEENAFIGAKSIILKGVTIGKNSIIAAGSVVTKSVPDNEIWGGNPAKFIRKITITDNEDPPCFTFSQVLRGRDNVCRGG